MIFIGRSRKFGQMTLRNVLLSKLVEIENFYLDKVRVEDVSEWHLAISFFLRLPDQRESGFNKLLLEGHFDLSQNLKNEK